MAAFLCLRPGHHAGGGMRPLPVHRDGGPVERPAVFSPLARIPVTSNARYTMPALARDPRFDSVVLGTSTSRLMQPALLDRALGAFPQHGHEQCKPVGTGARA
ncbi:hypothetical protein RAA17_23800 [Komagataeibacter rhaeticus]|nr:hypothetical protein [Komagataeibacter rhaeticus]